MEQQKTLDSGKPLEILAQAQAGVEPPHGWIVFRLLRNKVALAIAGWTFGIAIGVGLFVWIAPIVIPTNYLHGLFPILFTSCLLGMLVFIAIGSLWALIVDVQRLRRADEHLIVITPEDFVKQEGKKIIHVPLMYVRHVTARGKPPTDRTVPREPAVRQVQSVGENLTGFILGRGAVPSGIRMRRKRMRTPTTLAFVDSRDDSEVLVVTDESYGDPYMIAALLKQYAARVQNIA